MAAEQTNETEKANEIKQPVNPIVLNIERNGVNLKFTEARTTKGREAGKRVFEPETANEATFLRWIGVSPEVNEALAALASLDKTAAGSNVTGIARQKVRALTIGWADEATDDDTNEFAEQAFIQYAQSFDAAGESIGDLKDERDELQQSLVKIDLTKAENHPKLVELGLKIQELTIAINKKSRKKKNQVVELASQAA